MIKDKKGIQKKGNQQQQRIRSGNYNQNNNNIKYNIDDFNNKKNLVDKYIKNNFAMPNYYNYVEKKNIILVKIKIL